MLNTLTTIFVTIATIYILVVGVNLPLPSEHKKFLKNDYFLATLMFFLCYFYTGNIGITIFGLIFYFYFKYYIKNENKNIIVKPRNFFQIGIFGDLFKKYDELTDEEYEKIKKEFEDKEKENDKNIIKDEDEVEDKVEDIVEDEVENNVSEKSENIEYNLDNEDSSNLKTICEDKNDKLFNYNDLKNEVNEDIVLDKNLSEDFDVIPNNNFSKNMDGFEYINKESEHFSDIENIKNNIDMSINPDDTIIPFEKENNLVALTN